MLLLSSDGPLLHDFVDWCESSFLNITVENSNEMYIEFGKKPTVISPPVVIDSQAVEMVKQCKYFGTVIDN